MSPIENLWCKITLENGNSQETSDNQTQVDRVAHGRLEPGSYIRPPRQPVHSIPWAETWRRLWWGRKNFRMTFLGKISILTSKISDDDILHENLILCNIYDPFLAEKPLFQNKTFLHDTFLKSVRTLQRIR